MTEKKYLATWAIDVWAEDPEDAARQAWAHMRRSDSIANVFNILDENGVDTQVDLQEIDEANAERATAPVDYEIVDLRGFLGPRGYCDTCGKEHDLDELDCKPTMTFGLWLISRLFGQASMLAYASDHGHAFDRLECCECYGDQWSAL